jgi:hypothetical protein
MSVVLVLAGIATELPAQAHTHEEIGYRPPTLLNLNAPSVTGNQVSGASFDGVLVPSLSPPQAAFSAEQPTRIPLSHRINHALCNPRTHFDARMNKQFYRNPSPRKTIPRS